MTQAMCKTAEAVMILPWLLGGSDETFVEGADCNQSGLFLEWLEDWIGDDNPVRVIDAVFDALNPFDLGFEQAAPRRRCRLPLESRKTYVAKK